MNYKVVGLKCNLLLPVAKAHGWTKLFKKRSK